LDEPEPITPVGTPYTSYNVLTDFNTQIASIFLFPFLLAANPTVFTGLVAKNHLAPSANYVEASGIVRRIPSVQVGRVLVGFFVSAMIRLSFET
jgi:hypothetical protein